MTSAANARHARPRARTLQRAGGRTVAVLGFAAVTWAAFTGTAMALDGAEQPDHQTSGQASGQGSGAVTAAPGTDATKPGIRLGDAVGSLTDDAVRGVTDAAGAATAQSQAPAAVETTEASAVHGLTTYAVPQSSTAQPADDPTTASQSEPTPAPAPAPTPDQAPAQAPAHAPTGGLSIVGVVGGAEDAANDLTGSVLTATQLDQALPAPKVELLTSTLEALAVTDALPTVPLPQLSVLEEPVAGVLGTLPADVSSGIEPALSDLTGGLVTPLLPGLDPGSDTPIQASPATVAPSAPTAGGALPVLPILLPIEAFPGLGSIDSPATFASLADGGANGTVRDDVYVSRALLQTSDADAGDSSVPLPSGPSSPAGGPDGGSGSSHQQGGQLSSFTLPGGGLVSLVRDYRWHLPAAPTFDPGFSPD
ncbi:hypothetical protein ABTZ46_18485 [Nocardioides sp. NPDC126508]